MAINKDFVVKNGLTVGENIDVDGKTVIDSTGEVVTGQLKNSGVTPGAYGSSTEIPIIIVDEKGRLTSASSTSIVTGNDFLDGLTFSSGVLTASVGSQADVTINLDGRYQPIGSYDNYNFWRASDGSALSSITSGETVTFTGSGATNVVYNPTSQTYTISSTDNNDNDDNYVDSVNFNAGDGVLTLGRTGTLPDLTVDLDGRFQPAGSYDNYQYWVASDGTDSANISKNETVTMQGSGATSVNFNPSTQTYTISSTNTNTDTNTTYSLDGGSVTGGATIDLEAGGSGSGKDSVNIIGSGATTVGWNEVTQTITISSTDNNDNDDNYVDSASFGTNDGVLTLGRTGTLTDLTVDLDGRYLQDDTLTSLSHNVATKILTYTDEDGNGTNIDLSQYIDDTNLARITSGSVDANGLATFTRDDNTTFTVNFSVLFDDTNLTRITSAGFNTSDGILTLTRSDASTVTTDLDGRYLQSTSSHPASMITTTDEFTYSNSTNVQDVLDDLDQAIANVNAKDPTLTLTGDVSGSATFTNLGNATLTATVANNSHNHSVLSGTVDIQHTNLQLKLTDTTYSNNFWMLDHQNGDLAFQYNDVVTALTLTEEGGVDVANNITVSGTVDGRDVATDGTKLDTIETGATADQTATEILTAIKTVDGSGSGLDADLLDGLDSSKFIRKDTSDTMTGRFTATGGLVSGSNPRIASSAGNLELRGDTSSALMSVQDGSGRIQWRWNSSRGTSPTYLVSGEKAANMELIDVTSPTDSLWRIQYADSGTAGSPITFGTDILALGTTTFNYNGNKVWHAGNDGSGSGLDADLLDGQHSSSFLRSDVSDTKIGTLTLNDNLIMSSSAIELDSAWQIQWGGTNTYINGTSTALYANAGGSRRFTVDSAGIHYGAAGINTVWHAGNDGSGSGLDADLLDGQQGSYYANASLIVTTGTDNIGLGTGAINSITTGLGNTASGTEALYSNTIGNFNIGIGIQALYSNTEGHNNTASGRGALYSNTTGHSNTASGSRALGNNTTGYYNAAIGRFSLYSNTTGYENTASGRNTLVYNTTGNSNTANGGEALYSNTTGQGNTASGKDALRSNTTGQGNTALGMNAGTGITTGSYNITIGYGVDAPSGISDNQLNIGNTIYGDTSTGNVAIGTTTPRTDSYRLNMGGYVHMNNNQIDYVSQLHFNDNVRFLDNGNDSDLIFRGGDASTIKLILDTNGTARGSLYADSNNSIGFLDSDGNWAVRVVNDSYVELRDNNEVTFRAGQGGVDGSYGTVQTYSAGKGGWAGYSINARVVFMHDNSSGWGLYNDVSNNWLIYGTLGGHVDLRYNGATKLQTTTTGVSVTGLLTATQKSFTIDHPTKEGHKLRYGSLEGPENGVYVRGRLKGDNTIELPEYWKELVHEDSITVELTAIGKKQDLWVVDFDNETVTVDSDAEEINCFYKVYGERKDVDKLVTEFVE